MSTSFRLGVLTFINRGRFEEASERNYFAALTRWGEELGIDVIIFSPIQPWLKFKKIQGYRYHPKQNRWSTGSFPLPQLVLDRYRVIRSPLFHHYLQLIKRMPIPILNARLGNKWLVHTVLDNDEEVKKWLPETQLLTSYQQLLQMSRQYPTLFIKPINGTGGRSIYQLVRHTQSYSVMGRGGNRSLLRYKQIAPAQLAPLLRRLLPRGRKFVLQQGIDLQLLPQRMVDFRLLLQKDGEGDWQQGALIGKVGPRHSITSNLHGGGKAIWAERFLQQYFSSLQFAKIQEELLQLGKGVALQLEEHFGPLVELGLDVGIDREGKCWLIEVNPKPGRLILRRMGEPIYKRTTLAPLLYARHIYEKQRATELKQYDEGWGNDEQHDEENEARNAIEHKEE